MFIPDRQLPGPQALVQRGAILREFAMRQDRVPLDERVDLPEIQESYRVNFSDEALAASVNGGRDVLNSALSSGEASVFRTGLYLYEKNSGL